MKDATLVRISDGTRDRAHEANGNSRLGHQPSHVLDQARTLNELHAVVLASFVFTNLIDGHDVRMVERGRSFRFRAEPPHLRRHGQLARQDHL